MSWKKRVLCLAVILARALAADAAPADKANAEPLILAVHPYLARSELLVRFTPLADALAGALGRPVVVRVGNSFEEHEVAIGTDSVDIAYLGPAPYVVMVRQFGPKPLLVRQVVNGDPMLHGEIVVRSDSPIQTLADLKGKRFAFGDAQATAGHVIPAAMLRKAGIRESDLGMHRFLGSHRNVALAVLAGDYDAGAVKEEVFAQFAPRGLRSITTQLPVPDHVFVASRKLPPRLVDALRDALLAMGSTPAGQAAMRAIEPGLNEFVPVRDSDYDGLRALMDAPARVAR